MDMQKLIDWLKTFPAKLGQNIQFVAFWAHAGVSSWAVVLIPVKPIYTAIVIFVGAGVKEFWYDAKYEKDPPQTFLDNLEDFIGWGLGAVLGYLYTRR